MGFAFVMVKKYAGGTVHLRDDHALGPVYNECSITGHQRHFAHVDDLFFYIPDRPCAGLFIHVPHDKAQRDLSAATHRSYRAAGIPLHHKPGSSKSIIDKFQRATFRKILDWEDGFEDLLQPSLGPGPAFVTFR